MAYGTLIGLSTLNETLYTIPFPMVYVKRNAGISTGPMYLPR